MKERDSNIELLRIVAALFIIAVHCNGLFLNPLWGGVNNWFSDGYVIGVSRIVVQNITVLGVDLFVLISGFYGIRPKLKSVINLFTCLVFFYMGCYIYNCFKGYDVWSVHGIYENLLAFSHKNWFINCYLFLMLLSPIINAFVDSVNTCKLGVYTLVYCLSTLYFGSIMSNVFWAYNGGYSITVMVGVYLAGRYLGRITDSIDGIKYWHIILTFIGLITSMTFIRALAANEEAWLHYGSPITMAAAVTFFMLFYRMPKFHSKFINWIGASCLAPFILHTCDPMYSWISRKDISFFTYDCYPLYFLKMLLVIGSVFVLAILLDKIRIFIFSPLIKWSAKVKMLNNL